MNKTEAELQDTVQQMFQQPQVATDANSFNSFNSLPNETDLPKLMVMRSEVKVDQALKTQILNSLAANIHFEDILLKLEEEGDNAEIPTEQGTYRVKEGMLVFHPRSPLVQDGPYWKMVIPDDNEIKKVIMNELHSVPYAGHPGVAKTLEHTARYFFWKGMSADVRDFVLQCDACQVEKADHRKYAGPLQPLQVPERKWSEVAVDFVTGLPRSSSGNDAVLTAVDRATKMAYFLPCQSTIDARQIARLFWKEVASRHGVPASLSSDRGSIFTSAFWREL